jgi:ribosomal protein L2
MMKHSRLAYVSMKKERMEMDNKRKEQVIKDIIQTIPPSMLSQLRTDLKYSNYLLIQDHYLQNLEPPKYMLKNDPLTIIPKDDRVCVKALSIAKRKTGGRNYTGKICTRRIGGGFKRRIRLLDRHRATINPQRIIRIEHDPNRSAKLMLLQDTLSKRLSYRIAPDGITPGQLVKDTSNEDEEDLSGDYNQICTDPGACLPLKLIPLGSRIHDIESLPGGGGKLVKAAGTHATLVGHVNSSKSQVKLPSGKSKLLSSNCRASIGVVGNSAWHLRVIGKAGRSRNLGIRPHVRGVAMNAVDHPHGGGKGGRGQGKPSQSPWGKVCK